ncbi:MAG: hypothetical protein ACOYOB_18070, partial [Myxococcota bacterium]
SAEVSSWPTSTSSQAGVACGTSASRPTYPDDAVQHRSACLEGFTARYHVHRLMHVEPYESIEQAIRRE